MIKLFRLNYSAFNSSRCINYSAISSCQFGLSYCNVWKSQYRVQDQHADDGPFIYPQPLGFDRIWHCIFSPPQTEMEAKRSRAPCGWRRSGGRRRRPPGFTRRSISAESSKAGDRLLDLECIWNQPNSLAVAWLFSYQFSYHEGRWHLPYTLPGLCIALQAKLNLSWCRSSNLTHCQRIYKILGKNAGPILKTKAKARAF